MSRLRAADVVFLASLSLLLLGIVMVTSAGLSVDAEEAVSVRGILGSRTTLYAAAALALFFVGRRVDVGWWLRQSGFRHPAVWLLVVSVACLLLVHVDGLGAEAKGARRWIRLGPESWSLTFQPSEVAKWATIVVIAGYVGRAGRERLARFRSGLVPGLAILCVICGLIIGEDLGTAVLILAVGVCLLWAGGARLWQTALLLPLPLAGVIAAIVTSDYRQDRIRAFLDPYADPAGTGYHIIQSLVAITNGGLSGRGLGHGTQKFGYLPEDTTDFVFAIICEETGVVGALVVVLLYAGLLLAGLRILEGRRDAGERLVALGILLTIGFQALMNLMVVTGLAPTKGIALPLVSAGGTGWLLTGFALGVLAGMDDRTVAGDPAMPLRTAPIVSDLGAVRSAEAPIATA